MMLHFWTYSASARDEEMSSSNIDLMVRFNKQKSLLAFVRLERELRKLPGRRVDLVTENSAGPHLRTLKNKDMRQAGLHLADAFYEDPIWKAILDGFKREDKKLF